MRARAITIGGDRHHHHDHHGWVAVVTMVMVVMVLLLCLARSTHTSPLQWMITGMTGNILVCPIPFQAKARPHIEAACRSLLAEGCAISLREIEARVPREVLTTVERLFDMLQDIQRELGVR